MTRSRVTRAISGHATPAMQLHYSTARGGDVKQALAKVAQIATAGAKAIDFEAAPTTRSGLSNTSALATRLGHARLVVFPSSRCSMLPTVPYLVIDQNAFRKPHLLNPAIQRAGTTGSKLLIIDAAIIEMMKNPQWELTATKSLAGLAGCPELVALGHGIPDLMYEEFRTGEPAYDKLEDVERTASLRALLKELQA